jgi:hypothetical protein
MIVTSGGSAYAAVIGAGGTLDLGSGAVAGSGLNFAGPGAVLDIGGTALPTTAISGFAPGDRIDLTDIVPGAAPSGSIDSATDTLHVSAGGASYALTLAPGNYAGETVRVTGDTGSGSLVQLACFAAGTRIATNTGDRAVEDLAVGDHVYTNDRRLAPVRWVGRRTVDCRRHPRPEQVMPVRIVAGAFGLGVPRRDLLLSPDHAVFTGGVLIPVRYLVNFTTVAPVAVDAITYFHVELDHHDVILAEGLPAESFLDTGNRAAFANGGGHVDLHADFARRVWDAEACAELVLAGAKLAVARRRLQARAAELAATPIAAPLARAR